jgi:hypothetical protein
MENHRFSMPRPKTDRPRYVHIPVYFAQEDADYLDKLIASFGIRSRGSLITWIIENLMNDGFAPIAGARVCAKILKAMDKSGVGTSLDFKLLFRRELPPFPEVTLTPGDIDKAIRDLEALKTELEKKEK